VADALGDPGQREAYASEALELGRVTRPLDWCDRKRLSPAPAGERSASRSLSPLRAQASVHLWRRAELRDVFEL
jgi:hypothetical protein